MYLIQSFKHQTHNNVLIKHNNKNLSKIKQGNILNINNQSLSIDDSINQSLFIQINNI